MIRFINRNNFISSKRLPPWWNSPTAAAFSPSFNSTSPRASMWLSMRRLMIPGEWSLDHADSSNTADISTGRRRRSRWTKSTPTSAMAVTATCCSWGRTINCSSVISWRRWRCIWRTNRTVTGGRYCRLSMALHIIAVTMWWRWWMTWVWYTNIQPSTSRTWALRSTSSPNGPTRCPKRSSSRSLRWKTLSSATPPSWARSAHCAWVSTFSCRLSQCNFSMSRSKAANRGKSHIARPCLHMQI